MIYNHLYDKINIDKGSVINMEENNSWNDIMKEEKENLDNTISELQKQDKKYEVSKEVNKAKSFPSRQMVGYANTYSSNQIPPRKKQPTKRVVSGQNIHFENLKKIKNIILKIVITASLAGTVAMVAKYITKSDESEKENIIPVEQEYKASESPEAIAAKLAEKEKNTPSEVDYIKDVNSGKYEEPLITDQFSTEKTNAPHATEDNVKHVRTWSTDEGYTPLSEDPNYNPPTEQNTNVETNQIAR